MSGFQLEVRGPVGEEVRRILLDQVEVAVTALSGRDRLVGVHQARKACKRARAVVRLARSGTDRAVWRGLDRAFGQAARGLAPMRDAEVVPQTLRRVAGDLEGLVWSVPDAPSVPDAVLREASARLAALRDPIAEADLSAVSADALIDGFHRSWRDARGALAEAREVDDPDILHDWRKTTKRVYHQLQVLQGLWPTVVAAIVGELDALKEMQGAHHDLAVVAETLDREASPETELARVDERLRARGEALRAQALARGRLVFAAPARTLAALLEAGWSARL